jgi:hypothetical protein
MSLSRKVKTALDENRLLILGAQVLFGFQFHGVFQEGFAELAPRLGIVDSAALVLMAVTIGLLIAPSMQHRIVERGADTRRIHRVAGVFAEIALAPFGISLGLDFFIVLDHLYGAAVAAAGGAIFCALAALCWFILGGVLRAIYQVPPMTDHEEPTPLETRIEQMLTEARIVVPGAQALLGFQLAVTFTRAFTEMPEFSKLIHVGSLCSIALTVIVLMTPAALHRIAFGGQDSNRFLALGSILVLIAPFTLAIGLAADMQVAIAKATSSQQLGAVLAAVSFAMLLLFWYGIPLWLRRGASDLP